MRLMKTPLRTYWFADSCNKPLNAFSKEDLIKIEELIEEELDGGPKVYRENEKFRLEYDGSCWLMSKEDYTKLCNRMCAMEEELELEDEEDDE